MTFVGKILTVLIFVLALVFGSMTVMVIQTHKNWQTAARELKEENETLETEKKEILVAKEALRLKITQQIAARRSELAALNTKLSRIQDEIANKEADLRSKTKSLDDAQDTLKKKSDDNNILALTVERLEGEKLRAETARDLKIKEAEVLVAKINDLVSVEHILTVRNAQLVAQNARQKKVLKSHGLTEYSLTDFRVPIIEGYVTRVSKKNPNILEISIGSDDGIRTGHTLTVVSRMTKAYLGRAVVMEVIANTAVVKVENRQGIIKKDDIVTTRVK